MRFSLFLLILIGINACSLLDQQEQEPSYVIIDDVSVQNPDGNGVATHEVIDLWSFLDGQSLGVYPYPGHIPCLPENNEVTVSFVGGIRENGIASSVAVYPMLDPEEFTFNMLPGQEYKLSPVFQYRNDVIFRFNEGFENSSNIFSFDVDSDPSTKLILDEEVSISGEASGFIIVPDSIEYVEVATLDAFPGIPTDGTAVYLELDYFGDANLFIGLMGYQDAEALSDPLKSYFLGLVPTENWKKIYVNLTGEFFNSDFPAYRILIRVEPTGSGVNEGIHIDNLKLLHFTS